jgi:glycerol-3-phosphate dehydrogenase
MIVVWTVAPLLVWLFWQNQTGLIGVGAWGFALSALCLIMDRHERRVILAKMNTAQKLWDRKSQSFERLIGGDLPKRHNE